jgi:hypothetical protein
MNGGGMTVYQRTGTDPYAVPELPRRIRQPRFTPAPAITAAADPGLLERVAHDLRHMDDEPGTEPRYASVFDMLTGHPVEDRRDVRPPAPEPEPGSTRLLDYLTDLLDDAAEGAARRLSEPCEACPAKLGGWCEECMAALERAARDSRLAELLESAPDDRAVVAVLLAEGWR